MSELPSQERFLGALNQPFEVGPFTAPDGTRIPFQVQLVEVRQLVPGGPESFALRFRGPATPMLQQGTYPFTQPEDATSVFAHTRQAYVAAREADLPVGVAREADGLPDDCALYLLPSAKQLTAPGWRFLTERAAAGAEAERLATQVWAAAGW